MKKDQDCITGLERAEQILQMIRTDGSVNVNTLSQIFHVSGTTIRTDLTRLEEGGEIVRTHGGAMLRANISRELSINDRVHQREKAAICNRAVSEISEGDTLLLDTGSTMTALAQAILRSGLNNLRIYTNDLEVASILEANPTLELTLLGGKLRSSFHYCSGNSVIDALNRCHFDKLFLSTSALDAENGLSTSNTELAEVKEAMIRASREIILLADSSKIGRIEFRTFAMISEIDRFYTDSAIRSDVREALSQQISRIITVDCGISA